MGEAGKRTPRIRDGMRAALPLAPSPVLFGLSFGVLAEAEGFGAVPAVVMSATTFAGAAQFAAVGVLAAGGTVAAAVLAAVFLNARYAAISATVASIFPGGKVRRTVASQSIVDESWAIAGRSGRFEWRVLVGAGIVFYVCWVASTAVGTVAGGVLADPARLGLDAAFAALFLALAVPYPAHGEGTAGGSRRRRDHTRPDAVHAGRPPARRRCLRLSRGAQAVSDAWIVVVIVGVVTILFKAAGPLLLGRRPLPARAQSVVDLLAPAMLAALVVTQVFGGNRELVVDARVVGVAAAAVAIWREAHVVVAMVVAAVVTASLRALV